MHYDEDILKRDLTPTELKDMVFNSTMFQHGVLKDVDEKTLQKYLANPEMYKKELEKYAMYQYISNGDIFQLFDLTRVLPNLNYRVKTLRTKSKNDKHTLEVRRCLKEINHKELTRDILSQTIATGTLVGVWVGREDSKSKDYPYLMIFDDLEHFFPARRKNGKWTVWADLSYFNTVSDIDAKIDMINNLYPYITIEDYQNYLKHGESHRYIEFPVERSVCIRTHTLKRNQRFGISWNTQAIYDIKHKEKLKNLEKVASNKVMNAVAVLTIGIDGGDSTYKKLGEKLTRSIFENVKKGLMDNKEGEASVVGLPEFAKLEYPSQKTDLLDPEKMESVTDDIGNSIGVSRTLTNGNGGSYASAKLNLDILFNKIGELLENIESEVYNKLIQIILPSTVNKDYYLEYEKTYPLSNTEKANIYQKLASMGYSLRPLLELLGQDFEEFVDNTFYEIDTLKLREKVIPPLTSYTITDNNTGQSEETEETTNDNSINSQENDGNALPDASV